MRPFCVDPSFQLRNSALAYWNLRPLPATSRRRPSSPVKSGASAAAGARRLRHPLRVVHVSADAAARLRQDRSELGLERDQANSQRPLQTRCGSACCGNTSRPLPPEMPPGPSNPVLRQSAVIPLPAIDSTAVVRGRQRHVYSKLERAGHGDLRLALLAGNAPKSAHAARTRWTDLTMNPLRRTVLRMVSCASARSRQHPRRGSTGSGRERDPFRRLESLLRRRGRWGRG